MRTTRDIFLNRRLYYAGEAALLAGMLSAGALSSRAADWHPAPLVALLLALSVAGRHLKVRIRDTNLTSSFVGLVLAMALLGPTPAMAFAVLITVIDLSIRRRPPAVWLIMTATAASFTLAGGWIVWAIVGDVHDRSVHHVTQSPWFGLLVFGVFLVTNLVNFSMVAMDMRVLDGDAFRKQFRYLFVPLLPAQLAIGGLTAVLAVAYTNFGYPVLLGLVLVLAIFQYLAAALVKSEDRAGQLEARTIRLASLQLGVLTTLMETLALRDRAAARHAAAVARYSRDLARESGCSEADQDLAHTAGLLHDIGKFALPDKILHATNPSPTDAAVIRRHPQEGSTLVGRLDGYGPVADIILYHHERVDGTGYPAALIGAEIPFLSRVVAVANAYDNLTARDARRSPVTPQDAIIEMRAVAGKTLDADLVEQLIEMLQRHGPVTHAAGDDADFAEELAFEQRARLIAAAVAA